ncbi:hypothetical protein KIPB_007527, partial [Kipferlia bialata]|eukprot:g7527.t1
MCPHDGNYLPEADMALPDLEADFEEHMPDESLPSCSYCGLCDPAHLVMCNTCGRFFCNGRSNTSGSHIVEHLVRARHHEIKLLPTAPIGDTSLECYRCGTKNIFQMGFAPARLHQWVVFLCRDRCLPETHNAEEWDSARWKPLIHERCLLPWLCPHPTDEMAENLPSVGRRDVEALEQCFRHNNEPGITEIQSFEPVADSFTSHAHYISSFTPLLDAEAEEDRHSKEAQTQSGIDLRWERTPDNERFTVFFSARHFRLESELKLVPGDELELSKGDWTARGSVIGVTSMQEEIALDMDSRTTQPKSTGPCDVSFVWKDTTYQRMHRALDSLGQPSRLAPHLQLLLLGCPGKNINEEIASYVNKRSWRSDSVVQRRLEGLRRFEVPGLPSLNLSQISAIRHAILSPLSLIQGPPGTGKTVVSTALVHLLVKSGVKGVLVSAPSNVACDQLAKRLHDTGLKVVRVLAKSREALASPVEGMCLHSLVKRAAQEGGRFQTLMDLQRSGEPLSNEKYHQLNRLINRVEQRILDGAEVVVCTCATAGGPRLQGRKFKSVLIDEATQAQEPEVLIGVVTGAEHLVLVGDHQQLGPVVMSNPAARAGLSRSLFERLVARRILPVRLEVQYRMHPALAAFSSLVFYDGALQDGVSAIERTMPGLPLIDPQHPLMFLHASGQEEISSSGTSYLNRTEASLVVQILSALFRTGLHPSQIGVVTPYDGQRAYIQAAVQ